MAKGVKNATEARKQSWQDQIDASRMSNAVTVTTAYLFVDGEFVATAKINMGPFLALYPKIAVSKAMAAEGLNSAEWDVFVPLPNHYYRDPLQLKRGVTYGE